MSSLTSPVRAIIFDVGGVMTHGSFSTSFSESLAQHYHIDPIRIKGIYVQEEEEYLNGNESQHDFFKRLALLLNLPFEYETLSKLFTSLIRINHEVVTLIKGISDKYDCLIASDNYKEMVEFLRAALPLDQYFKLMLFSNELHQRKVSKDFFAQILSRYEPAECVFIDDKAGPIELGNQIGFRTIYFKDAQQLHIAIADLGVEVVS